MSDGLQFKYIVTEYQHEVEAAKVLVPFYVTRGDLVEAAALAIDHEVSHDSPLWKFEAAGAGLSKAKIEEELRSSLRAYGTMFTEFGASDRIIAGRDVYPIIRESAQRAVARLYPGGDEDV